MNKLKPRVVEELDLGLYVWLMPNGQLLGDGDGNYLNIPAQRGDQSKIANITTVAHSLLKSNGFEEEGSAIFQSGRRRVTDEEFEEQKARLKSGLVPDEYDVASMLDTLRAEKRFNE